MSLEFPEPPQRADVSHRVLGDTLIAASALRLAGVVLMLPLVLSGGRPTALAALALTTVVVAGQLAAWPSLSGLACAVPVILAADVFVAAGVLWVDGIGWPMILQLLGAVMVGTALLGGVGVGLAVVVGAEAGFLVANDSAGAAGTTALAASVPIHFVLWASLVVVVRHIFVKRELGRQDLRRRSRAEATDSERARLARELHDSAAKTVVGISLSATSLRRLVREGDGGARADRVLADISAAAEAAAAELREVIAGLRQPGPDAGVPLARALDRLVTSWGESVGVTTAVHVPDDLGLDADAGGVALAVVEECLANAHRHASAGRLEVRGRPDGERAVLEVVDDGQGFAVPTSPQELVDDDHFGLVGMTERARLAGGDLRLASGTGGTTITLVLPRRLPAARGRAARGLTQPLAGTA